MRAQVVFKERDPEDAGHVKAKDNNEHTANFRQPACAAQLERGACRGKSCLSPEPCVHLQADHQDYLRLLRSLRQRTGIKKVFIRSGIRYDYLLLAKDRDEFLHELCQYHVSGQLKVAPEHVFGVQEVQRAMLEKEGVVFLENGCIDM